MKKTTCPFCMKATLKGYPFTPYSDNTEILAQPYDTGLNNFCSKCCHCAEMEQAIARKEYENLRKFCLSYVNGRGEFKSLMIRFDDETTVFTSPNYEEKDIPSPYIIGQDETKTLKARFFTLHSEFWADFYGSDTDDCYTWWDLELTFDDKTAIHKKGTDVLPPQWNKLLKIIGVYYKWMLQDFSAAKMFKLKYNHRTRQREKPANTLPSFTDYWSKIKKFPPTERLPTPDNVKEDTKVCIYARTNDLGDKSKVQKQMEACRTFCKEKKLQIVAEYIDEGVTGLNGYGKALRLLMAEAKEKEFTHIVLASVSRFSRDIGLAVKIRRELERQGLTAIILPPKKWGYWHYY